MKTYYLLRHGLATHSTHGYGQEIVSAHVLPEGIPPIKKMAEFLSTVVTDENISSELNRCKETAEIISNITGKQFKTDARINEFSIDENYSNETFANFRDRVLQFLMDIEQSSSNSVLVCTHGAVVAGIKNILHKGSFTEEEVSDFPKPGVLVTIHADGTLEEKDFNE